MAERLEESTNRLADVVNCAANRFLVERICIGVEGARYSEGLFFGLARAFSLMTGAPEEVVAQDAIDQARTRSRSRHPSNQPAAPTDTHEEVGWIFE